MSKTQKPCNNRKCSKVKQTPLSEDLNKHKKFFEALKKKQPVSPDPEEKYYQETREKELRRQEEDYLENLWGPYTSAADAPEEDTESEAEYSNVEFMIGRTIEDTEIFVEGSQLKGCIKASLDFDAELGVPTLTLTIINPTIGVPVQKIRI